MPDSSEARVYFQHGRFRVTDDIVRARTRSIQLSTIEGVEVSRPLFAMALAGCAGVCLGAARRQTHSTARVCNDCLGAAPR